MKCPQQDIRLAAEAPRGVDKNVENQRLCFTTFRKGMHLKRTLNNNNDTQIADNRLKDTARRATKTKFWRKYKKVTNKCDFCKTWWAASRTTSKCPCHTERAQSSCHFKKILSYLTQPEKLSRNLLPHTLQKAVSCFLPFFLPLFWTLKLEFQCHKLSPSISVITDPLKT